MATLLNAVITGAENVKLFASAVHALSKIGDDVCLEVTHQGAALFGLTHFQTVYAVATFHRGFFSSLEASPSSQGSSQTQDSGSYCLCITAKAIANAFRAMKGVESLQMYGMDGNSTPLLHILASLKHGVKRTHSVAYLEAVAPKIAFSNEAAANQASGDPKPFAEMVNKLHKAEAASLLVHPVFEILQLQGYREQQRDAEGKLIVDSSIHASVALATGTFGQVACKVAFSAEQLKDKSQQQLLSQRPPVNVTFSTKEFKHFLSLVTNPQIKEFNLLSLYWNEPGDPIKFVATNKHTGSSLVALEMILPTVQGHVRPHEGSPMTDKAFLKTQRQPPS